MHESIVEKYKRHKEEREKPLMISLEKKLKLIEENFNLSDKEFNKYSTIKSKLTNGYLFLGEVTRLQKELKVMKEEMFDVFKKTWNDLLIYSKDIPSNTLKKYQIKFDIYNFDVTRNRFNETIFDKKRIN